MSSSAGYNYILPYTIWQYKVANVDGSEPEPQWELDRSPYIEDLTDDEKKETIVNPDYIYSKQRTHITQWSSVAGPILPHWSRPSPHDGRCYVNNKEDNGASSMFVRVIFDEYVSLSRIIFTYIHYQPWFVDSKNFQSTRRFPANLVVRAKVGLSLDTETYPILLNEVAQMQRPTGVDWLANITADPYNIDHEGFTERGGMDMYQSVIVPEVDEDWIRHGVEYLDFYAEGDDASPFDISRIYCFGANTEICADPNIVPFMVKPWNTKQMSPLVAIGGPNTCLSDLILADPENTHIYTYGPYSTLPGHYQFLAGSHDNDLFSSLSFADVYFEQHGSSNSTAIPFTPNSNIINTPMNVGLYVIELEEPYTDVYQCNMEYTGALRDSGGDTIITFKLFNEIGDEQEYICPHEYHESSTTVHGRSRGVTSRWFPGFPWHQNGRTCIAKNTQYVEIGIFRENPFDVIPNIERILVRGLSPNMICSVSEDPIIFPNSDTPPDRNSDPLILGDWAPTVNYTWDESKQTYTSPVFQTPAYANNSVYPDFNTPETYAVLDKKYSKYFQDSASETGNNITRLCDGFLHVVDPFIPYPPGNMITFSTPVVISFMRVFILGPSTNAPWMQISISTFDGTVYPQKQMQYQVAQDFIVGPGEHPVYTGGYFRTLPWDPSSQSLFTNLKSLHIQTNQSVVGLQVWGHYLPDSFPI